MSPKTLQCHDDGSSQANTIGTLSACNGRKIWSGHNWTPDLVGPFSERHNEREPHPIEARERQVCLLPRSPKSLQVPLPNLICPMMACLMHDGTDISPLLVLPVIKDVLDTHTHVLLQQHSSPPPRFPYAFPPSTDLSLIIFTPSTHVEAAVPLKPSSYVICVIDPPGSFPFFYALARGDFVFVDLGVVSGGGEKAGYIEAGIPCGW